MIWGDTGMMCLVFQSTYGCPVAMEPDPIVGYCTDVSWFVGCGPCDKWAGGVRWSIWERMPVGASTVNIAILNGNII